LGLAVLAQLPPTQKGEMVTIQYLALLPLLAVAVAVDSSEHQ
jgi:hypothetical protein